MKILLVNQCFFPDVVSSAQHLTDLALELTMSGHKVTVLAGRRGYDDPKLRFPKKELWNGITIIRIPSTGLGKKSVFSRAVDFGSFIICCFARMLVLPRVDAVVSMTSPPLISFIASLLACLKGERFYFWIMDMNPDEAIAAGWLRKDSRIARILASLLTYGIEKARRMIVLDRFMKERLLAKGAAENKIVVVPPWSHDQHVSYDPAARTAFRAAHGLTDKFVVMYSGNHSPCHPLNTLLQAALQLAHHSEISFLFVGGGSEFGKAKEFVQRNKMGNVDFLPYQPLESLAGTLSAADLHVAVMGNAFAGIVHPCKIYNILSVGCPFLYIGPEESHIGDIIKELGHQKDAYIARHGEVGTVTDVILEAQRKISTGERRGFQNLGSRYSAANLLPRMVEALECSPDVATQVETVWDYSNSVSATTK
jgi:colanic acid biosynthesis glycosyl transferase WcaI